MIKETGDTQAQELTADVGYQNKTGNTAHAGIGEMLLLHCFFCLNEDY